MFAVVITVGKETATIKIPLVGKNLKGEEVLLENPRLEFADPKADGAKATITPHASGTEGWFSVADKGKPGGVHVVARADGHPGAGVREVEEDGFVGMISGDAARFGEDVGVATETRTEVTPL